MTNHSDDPTTEELLAVALAEASTTQVANGIRGEFTSEQVREIVRKLGQPTVNFKVVAEQDGYRAITDYDAPADLFYCEVQCEMRQGEWETLFRRPASGWGYETEQEAAGAARESFENFQMRGL